MKKELKTLKDLRKQTFCEHDTKDDLGEVCASCLKDEAVKWIKHLEKEKIRLKEDIDQVINCADRIEMFKHFFNLTAKDLDSNK